MIVQLMSYAAIILLHFALFISVDKRKKELFKKVLSIALIILFFDFLWATFIVVDLNTISGLGEFSTDHPLVLTRALYFIYSFCNELFGTIALFHLIISFVRLITNKTKANEIKTSALGIQFAILLVAYLLNSISVITNHF